MHIYGYMRCGNMRCNRTCVSQTLLRHTIQPGYRDNKSVSNLLWAGRHPARSIPLHLGKVRDDDVWMEVQTHFQTKNKRIPQQPLPPGSIGLWQYNGQGISWIPLMLRLNIRYHRTLAKTASRLENLQMNTLIVCPTVLHAIPGRTQFICAPTV